MQAPTLAELAERIEEMRRDTIATAPPPLAPQSRNGLLPLSFAQQRLWFVHQLDRENPAYNSPHALLLKGRLDEYALVQSLQALVQRHEVLRTTYALEEDGPVQVIRDSSPPRTANLGSAIFLAPEVRESEQQDYKLRPKRGKPFDLVAGPTLRSLLIKLSDEENILLLTLHHIVTDGWSSTVLTQEVSSLYNAFCNGRPSPLQDLLIQYADYAAWQREWLKGDVLEPQLSYWREQLEGAPTLLELPTDRARPSVQTYRGATERLTLSSTLTRRLKTLCLREGVTQFMTLLSAFQVLLYRYSGQTDFVIGTVIANRTRSETEGLIGCFFNSLALRSDLSGDPSIRELLSRVRDSALGAYAHQDMPFEKLIDELRLERSLSNSPLFQVMFVLQNAPSVDWNLDGLQIEPIACEGPTAKFDLMICITEDDGKQLISLEYSTDLFDAEQMERLLGHYQTLLSGMVDDPNQPVSRLPLLTQPECDQLLVRWNDTACEYPRTRCVHELFELQAERTPEAPALVFGGEDLTFAQLNHRSNQLARYLQKLGVGPDVLVGLCVERSVEMVVGLLGILKAGGAYVPLDPSYPAERLAFMLADARPAVLLTVQRLRQQEDSASLETVCLDADWERIASEGTGNPINSATADNLAYVIYTSGSTGRPKGAMVRHGGLTNYLSWAISAYDVACGQGSPLHSSLSFDLTVTSLFPALLSGGCVELLAEADGVEALGHALSDHPDFSLVKITPAHLELLSLTLPSEQASGATRSFIIGGEALFGEQLSFWREHAAKTRLINEYGPTETVVGCCVYECGSDSELGSGAVPIGRPIANTRLYVLDGSLRPTPLGVAGELYIGGDGLGRGYLNRADLTAERFVPDPYSTEPGARLYKTGDLVKYLKDGNLEYLGRLDHQVKIRGFRIELGEIESALLALAGVREAVVLAREDTPGSSRLVAYVTRCNEAVSAAVLREHIKNQLPAYMVPSAFVFLEALPLTPNGKLDRKALPSPDASRSDLQDAYTAPVTEVEQSLADIWSKVLRLEKVGIHDNFFELGGDSILSIQIISRANQAGLCLTPRQIFEHQTIALLAAVAGTGPEMHAEQESVTGAAPLTPIQRWFFERELPESHHYNHAHLLELRNPFSNTTVETAIIALLAHHDALRLRFERSESGWRQFHAAVETNGVLSTFDLSAVSAAEQSAAIEEAAEQLQANLNIETGPLVRAAYFDLGPMKHARLLLVIHHLAVDGVSWRVLFSDLTLALEQLGRGEPVALPSKTTSFQHWAKRLEEYGQSDKLRQELNYWLAEERTCVPDLPRDHPCGNNAMVAERSVEISLNAQETRALLQDVPSVYHTRINDVLLTALGKALGTWSGACSVLIDLEGHGREPLFDDVDISRTIGWFTSLFPVLLELPDGASPGEWLKSVKEQLHRIPNRGMGYGLLRYMCSDTQICDRLAALPIAQISFNYLGQLDYVVGDSTQIRATEQSVGRSVSQLGERSHAVSVLSRIRQDRLEVRWLYSENAYFQATVERLAETFLSSLREIITHCQSPEAGGFTPSRLSQSAG